MQLCQLKYLNLSSNNLSGTIPSCVFSGMASLEVMHYPYMSYPYMTYSDGVKLSFNFREFIRNHRFYYFSNYFSYVLDLSSNNLSGKIPTEVISLGGLLYLNLSRNHLVGPIPPSIGEMENLEVLDLSTNHLSCTMPTAMIDIPFLMDFNVSYNNLSGEILHTGQVSTFPDSSYIGNHQLCGPPLSKICPSNESFGDPHCSIEEGDEEKQGIQKEEQYGFEITSFYLSMGLGFIAGYCGFWCSLLMNRSWRCTYFRFLGNMNDKISGMVQGSSWSSQIAREVSISTPITPK